MDLEGGQGLGTTSPLVKPLSKRLRVLYLVAGAERKADVGECVVKAMAAARQKTGLACYVEVENVDILRNPESGDLLVAARREGLLARIAAGEFDLVLAAPPCNTFSRALLFHDLLGPAPLRDKWTPWGKPGLTGFALKKVDGANELVVFSLQALEAAAKCPTKLVGAWLEFPEDLGDAACGAPASLWQLPEALALSLLGL